jgi:PAP2 superfamily
VSVIASKATTSKRWIVEAILDLKLLSPSIVVSGVFVLTVAALGHAMGLQGHVQLTLYALPTYLSLTVGAPLAILFYYFYLMVIVREKHPIARMRRDLIDYLLQPKALLSLVVSIVAVSYVVSAYSSFKSMISAVNPFYLDPALAKIDAFVHFGIQPWRITHFFFSDFASAITLNVAYNAWFFIVWGYAFCQILALAGREHRAHFLLSFVLCWSVLGAFLAVLLSSAGPCYFGKVTHLPDPFTPLMQQLYAIDAPHTASDSYWHLWALSIQERLWTDEFLSTTSIGGGISAMPSMHVSMAFLLAFSALKIGRWFGRVMLAYAIIIAFGSVYLGWHYAIDGYVSILMTYGIWRLSGLAIGRISRRDDVMAPATAEY